MPHACLAASYVALQIHRLHEPAAGRIASLLHVADAVMGSYFRQFCGRGSKGVNNRTKVQHYHY